MKLDKLTERMTKTLNGAIVTAENITKSMEVKLSG